MTPQMAFECLLVSQDPGVLRPMTLLLNEFSIDTKICSDPSKVGAFLGHGNMDLLVLDAETEESLAAVRYLREQKHRKEPTVLAIAGSDCAQDGVHFVLRKPVTIDSGMESLKTAYSRMLRDYRKHTRFALMSRVLAMDENRRVIPLILTNIGEGGIGIACKHELATGSTLDLEIALPEISRKIKIRARVLWTRDFGISGCEFVDMSSEDRQILFAWLESRYRVKKPLWNFD